MVDRARHAQARGAGRVGPGRVRAEPVEPARDRRRRHRAHARGGGRGRARAAARARAALALPRRERPRATGEPEVAPIGDGHSNVTYALRRGDAELVVRRPPRGPLPPSAHDVLREARVLRALDGRAPVPRVLAVVRRRRRDRRAVLRDGADRGRRRRRTRCRRRSTTRPGAGAMGEELVDALVDAPRASTGARPAWRASAGPTATSSASSGASSGCGSATARASCRRSSASAGWLADHLPESPPATIVHGDFRLGNVMFAPRRAGRASWRSSTGRCRRSATRSPTSGTCARSGSTATTRPRACSSGRR